MSRPNRCIKDENGNDVWVSRSTVVIPVVFKLEEKTGDIYTLVEQRGRAVSHTNEWCCPCGFIDWDETLEEACQREVREETGLLLDMDKIYFVKDIDKSAIETVDEVIDVRWLKVAHVYKSGFLKRKINMDIYKKSIYDCYGTWAFKTHKDRIIEMLKMTVNGGKVKLLDE